MEIYWLWLSMRPGVGPLLQKRLLQRFGSPAAVYHAGEAELRSVEGLGPKLARHLREARCLDGAARLQEEVQKAGARLLTLDDPLYPGLVKSLPEAPALLYYRGTLREKSCGVGIVGARRCTPYGKEVAREAAAFLAKAGVPVISGMARGIDAYANTACLQAGGYTLAVLGCGVDLCFPAEHRELMEAIVQHGAVISAYPPGTAPRPEYFPRRNYLISAWSYALLVAEAAPRSGSLITAGMARQMGRPVFAAPNGIFSRESKGANALIATGDAAIYLHPRQLVPWQGTPPAEEQAKPAEEAVNFPAATAAAAPAAAPAAGKAGGDAATSPAAAQQLLDLLAAAGGEAAAEELALRFPGGKKHFWETLAELLLEGRVENLPGGRLRRAGKGGPGPGR